MTLSHYERHKGGKFLIKVIKEVRIALENYFISSNEKKKYKLIKLNYSGIPVLLKSAIHSIKMDGTKFKSLVLSLLTVSRSAIFKKEPDYSTITSPIKGSVDIPNQVYFDFISHLKNVLKIDLNSVPTFEGYHFSVKASPLGDNSMESLLVELVSIPNALLENIYFIGGNDLKFRINFLISNFRMIAMAIPGFTNCINKLIKRFSSSPDFIYPVDIFNAKDNFYCFLSSYVRKMVSFAEYEGKTRIIGLCDYWTQAALEPLASKFFQILSAIPNDQTFDQSEGCKELTFSNSKIYYSFDLTAFTDRFPLEVITNLLSSMYGTKYSKSISSILSGVPF